MNHQAYINRCNELLAIIKVRDEELLGDFAECHFDHEILGMMAFLEDAVTIDDCEWVEAILRTVPERD